MVYPGCFYKNCDDIPRRDKIRPAASVPSRYSARLSSVHQLFLTLPLFALHPHTKLLSGTADRYHFLGGRGSSGRGRRKIPSAGPATISAKGQILSSLLWRVPSS